MSPTDLISEDLDLRGASEFNIIKALIVSLPSIGRDDANVLGLHQRVLISSLLKASFQKGIENASFSFG